MGMPLYVLCPFCIDVGRGILFVIGVADNLTIHSSSDSATHSQLQLYSST
jgi:hypothetical protein